MNELHLFAGAGGGILAGQLLGHRCVCAVEWEPYAQAVLVARQNDGTFPPFPVWDDVQTFDGRPWAGIVDIVAGGFPCQDISAAGGGAGIDGERSGMWGHMARIIGEVRPRFVLVENSPMLTSRGLGRVLGDLAALGFDARWGVLGAAHVGAPHKRDRIWIVGQAGRLGQLARRPDYGQDDRAELGADGQHAEILADADSLRQLQREGCELNQRGWSGNGGENLADTSAERLQERQLQPGRQGQERQSHARQTFERNNWWPVEPELGRVVNGLAHRAHRLKAIGNGQVSRVAATAWELLT